MHSHMHELTTIVQQSKHRLVLSINISFELVNFPPTRFSQNYQIHYQSGSQGQGALRRNLNRGGLGIVLQLSWKPAIQFFGYADQKLLAAMAMTT